MDYPKMLYHADGRTQTVHSPEEEQGLDGFESSPSEIHRTPQQFGAGRVVTPPSPNDDLLAKIRGLFDEYFGEDKPKRGPGRPRKDSDNG